MRNKGASILLLERLTQLPELQLPEQWYEVAENERLPVRWLRIAELIQQERAKEISWDLATQFYNGGRTFRHCRRYRMNSVHNCSKCQASLPYERISFVNSARGQFVTLEGQRVHNVLFHQEEFDVDLKFRLKQLLGLADQ